MLTGITHTGVYVTDQDEALRFYVDTLGFEVADDIDLGFMRWLTVAVPGHPEMRVLLEVAGPPSVGPDQATQVRELTAAGAMGLGFILTVDDCRAEYERLKAAGVEFTDEPTERPYGIDSGFRDPFGNHIRMTQPAAFPQEPTRADFDAPGNVTTS